MIRLVIWTVFDGAPLSIGSTSWSIEPARAVVSVVAGGGTFDPCLPSMPPTANEEPATATTIAAAAAAGMKPARRSRWATKIGPSGWARGASLRRRLISPISAA